LHDRDGNEIAFGLPMQQQNTLEDYQFIYRHLAPKELTGMDAQYDMAHELGRGTFATVMKVMARNTGEWWAIKIIHTQKVRRQQTQWSSQPYYPKEESRQREISVLEKHLSSPRDVLTKRSKSWVL
jgi:serine/threonine/tyrosine protein kinase RAD53